MDTKSERLKREKLKKEFRKFLKALAAPQTTIGYPDDKREGGRGPICRIKKTDFAEGFNRVIDLIFDWCVKDQKKLIFIGNGGSAAIASHQALDFFNKLKIRTQTFNDPSLLTCMTNDYGYENVFVKPIGVAAERGDVLVAISSSGKSKNILRAVRAAIQKECWIVTMSGFDADNPLRAMGDINFYVPSFSYGVVEASHSLYWDFILEMLIEKKNQK